MRTLPRAESTPAADLFVRTMDAEQSANWLTGALVLLPFLQFLPLDFDRTAPLLVLPAIWFGRRLLVTALTRVAYSSRSSRIAAVALFAAVALAIAGAEQPAPALVAGSSWLVLTAAALLAGQLVASHARLGERLLAGIAVGVASATAFTWFLWLVSGRGAMPLYADPRHLGLHALSGCVAVISLQLRPGLSLPDRTKWFVVGAFVAGGLLWASGRTAMLGVGVGGATWCVCLRGEHRRRLVVVSAYTMLAGMLLSSCFWTRRVELGWWHMISRTSASIETGSASALTTARSDFWQDTFSRIQKHPWFGRGPDSYRFLAPKLDGQQPHNLALQLFLDVGLFGFIPAIWLLGRALIAGVQRRDPETLPWLALLAASTAASMLDGVFYHVLSLLPALIAGGVVLSSAKVSPAASPAKAVKIAGMATIVLASGVLILHAALFHVVAVAPPPDSPQAVRARVLRFFPSTTYGLWRWLDRWQADNPSASLEWARWAQTRSPFAPLFHVYAARCLLRDGDRKAAADELDAAIAKAHRTAKAAYRELRENLISVPHGPVNQP